MLTWSYACGIINTLFISFSGHSLDGYSVRIGVPTGIRDHGFSFTLKTPDKMYILSAQSEHDRDDWIEVIERVIERPLTPQDSASK